MLYSCCVVHGCCCVLMLLVLYSRFCILLLISMEAQYSCTLKSAHGLLYVSKMRKRLQDLHRSQVDQLLSVRHDIEMIRQRPLACGCQRSASSSASCGEWSSNSRGRRRRLQLHGLETILPPLLRVYTTPRPRFLVMYIHACCDTVVAKHKPNAPSHRVARRTLVGCSEWLQRPVAPQTPKACTR